MSKPSFFKLAFLVILLVMPPVMAAVHHANDHPVLFNFISNKVTDTNTYTTGNNIVDNGDDVVLGVGTFSGPPYSGSPYPNTDTVYTTTGIYFSLVCSGAAHSCVLNGSNSRRLMFIDGTGGGTTTLSGIHFLDSNSDGWGGALHIHNALVSVQGCKLSSNQAYRGGGILAQDSGTTVNIYSTNFDGNTASNGGGDIYVNWYASVTVHSTCPPGWSGTPAAGSDLVTQNYAGTLSGTIKSFDIG